MINFIIVDEFDFWLSLIEEKITKVFFKTNLSYHIYKFNDYNEYFFNFVFKNMENKVFILNSKIKNINGINIGIRIRSIDRLAEIIFLSNSYTTESINCFLTSSIKAIGFIEKNNLDLLELKLKEILNNYQLSKVIRINTTSNSIILKLSDILYIETKDRKTLIHTINSVIKTSKNLKYLEEVLNNECDFFIRVHRASIVNLNNVISFNFKEKRIVFFNNKKCNLLSKSYKKNIKDKIKNC